MTATDVRNTSGAHDAIAPLRVLLFDPSTEDAQRSLRELYSAGFVVEPTVVSTREEFVEALASGDFALVLSGDHVQDWDGMRALEEVRRTGKDIPVVLVTGVLSEEAALECVKRGVSEYVLKSRLAQLPTAIRHVLEEKRRRASTTETSPDECETASGHHQLIENSVYGIFRVTLDGAFLYANPVLLQILACPSLEILKSINLGGDVFRFPEHCAKLLAACRRNGMVHSVETEWRRRDGGFVAVKLHLRYLLAKSGSTDELEGVVEDVTELRALEHQLRQAQKFETIGELAWGVAHDFNNVIGAILGWAELGFEESQAYPQIADRFARIRTQADRAATLTRELLAIGRRQTLQPKSVDLNAVIRNLIIFLDKVIGSDIEIQVITHDLKPVHADPSQIEHVFINICLNARDAMPQGGRLIVESEMVDLDESYCRLHHDLVPGTYAVVSITDSGAGMAPEVRDRIFEPFFTTKERGKGTGMGLATAYGIVKQHNGFIHVYSEPGQGSLFRVHLPAFQENVDLCANQSAELARTIRPEGVETLLLAEDHDSIREMVRQSLVGLGYRVLSAANGEEALQLCDQQAPALAILDLIMPHMGGVATATRLRERFPDLPVVFTSGYSENKDFEASKLRNSFYLQKPYSPTALGRAVRKILDPSSHEE
jgi:two-component system cell cycle sensor histidine kinase/response regulator CckA